jgi:hypothetical protein
MSKGTPMNELRIKVKFSAEDGCWIATAKGFTNCPKQRARGHGNTPGIATLHCTEAAQLMFDLFHKPKP